VLAVRSGASEVAAVSRTRFGDAHAAVVALLLTLAGYAATVMSLLVLLQVPVGACSSAAPSPASCSASRRSSR